MGVDAGRSTSARRAVVAGRDTLLVSGVAAVLREKGWKTEAVDAADAASGVRKTGATLLVMDIAVLEDARQIAAARRANKTLRVMASIGERNTYLVRELQSAGASVVVHRQSGAKDIEQAFEAVASGQAFLCSTCQEDLAAAGKTRRMLSPRETEVLRLLGYGNTNKIVAEQLKISEKTVEAHRANIKRKLGARGLSDLVRHAISTGLVDTKDPIPPG